MNRIEKVMLIALLSICALGCTGSYRPIPAEPRPMPQATGSKKTAAWLTGNSRVLYQNSSYAILGLEHTMLSRPTNSILLDVFGIENKQKEASMKPMFFAFDITVKDMGGKKIVLKSFSFMRDGKQKVQMEHTPCILTYDGDGATCEIGIKITGEEVGPESIEVYTLVANAEGFDSADDAISVEMRKYYFDMNPKTPAKENTLAMYSRQ
jgi:hypothetical protein